MSDIASGVAAREGDLVALTRDLIRIPTINPPGGNYLPICRFIAARLERSGFVCALLRAEGAPGDGDRHPRWNLVARREGGSAGPCVHFNGHTDVVEVGRGWSVDPFGGELRDGRVYGRGACDMKGGIAAAIVAVEAFLEHPSRPSRRDRDSPRPPTRRPAATAAWPGWRNAAISAPTGSTTSSSPNR